MVGGILVFIGKLLMFLVIGKKMFSISLIFNSLLTIACSIGILGGFFWFYQGWQPFYPYLVDGNLFWVILAAGVINLFPSASLGRNLKTGRLLFHHYFYGFLVLLSSAIYVIIFTPVSLLTIFLIDNSSLAVNVGRFFILGGWALVLDDLPDVSEKVDLALNWLKNKARQAGQIIAITQFLTGGVTLYLFVAVCLAMLQNSQWVTLANFILVITTLITAITSFVFVKRRVWLTIETTSKNNL